MPHRRAGTLLPSLEGRAKPRIAKAVGIGQITSLPKKNDASSSDNTSFLIRWSIQEIRRIVIKLAQRRIQPAHIIAWSLWRRAHQAEARRAAPISKQQCNCNANPANQKLFVRFRRVAALRTVHSIVLTFCNRFLRTVALSCGLCPLLR
jgi:hypothetical protein